MLKTCIRAALCNSFKDQVQGLSKSMEGISITLTICVTIGISYYCYWY